ncbi:MAG: cryptochrome/photolyase family protein [Bacteroidota bacterium]
MKIALVFPHQLYSDNPAITFVDKVVLVEEHLYFTQYKFHKQKLVLHRASMRFYKAHHEQLGKKVDYIEFHSFKDLQSLFSLFAKDGVQTVQYVDTTDDWLEKKLSEAEVSSGVNLQKFDTPGFLTAKDELKQLMPRKKSGYFMASFYQKQRERMGLLMENGEPVGGKWSFDEENRKKLPKGFPVPDIYTPQENEYVKEAKEYVNQRFSDHYGSTDGFFYPVTYYQAEKWLEDFLVNRMSLFGDYEDALVKDQNFLFHSLLTAPLNIGLLTPQQILDKTFTLHEKYTFPLNSLEGFVRQIIGWREFMRGIYEFEGNFERTNNHWKHSRKIPESFWSGETGIEPVDTVIQKAVKYSYTHHIERLMVMGNFMLLCEFDPDEIYRWFMEMYIDAYDWVMVPNVYGMTQYADGGLITTKPYISGSNYIKKMSDFGKGEWMETWDGLYWRFIHLHKEEFAKNQRMSMMARLVEKMDREKLNRHLSTAEKFLTQLN